MLYEYPVYHWECVDGDTVNLLLDLGFGLTYKLPTRLKGLDAPETHFLDQRPAALCVKKVVLRWLLEAEGAHYSMWASDDIPSTYPVWDEPFDQRSTLRYESNSKDRDKYGRGLGILRGTRNVSTMSLNSYLLSQKIVRPYEGERKGIWTTREYEKIIAKCNSLLGI